jgi:hypothetical protein
MDASSSVVCGVCVTHSALAGILLQLLGSCFTNLPTLVL